MATTAYHEWVAAGRQFRLATPIAEMKALARKYEIGFLGDIGSDNVDHLQASFPEDHCPFSQTAWPVPLPGYVVCALDLTHEKGMAEALLQDAKDGRAPWVKYLNFGLQQYHIKREWEPVPNPDDHLHISIRSDWIDRSIGDYDPFVEDDMAGEGPAILAMILDGKSPTGVDTFGGGVPRVRLYREFHDLRTRLAGLQGAINHLAKAVAANSSTTADELKAAVLAAIDERLPGPDD